MATFVLVHGAWAGGWAFKRVAPLLRAREHDVFTPTLTGLGERVHLGSPAVNLDTHIQDVVNLLLYEDLQNVVLVGWSYSGMVVTGVLDKVPERLAHVVYLDAEVPSDGESEFDIAGQEFRNDMETRRWFAAKLASNGQPIETFRQPVRLSNPAADAVPRTFIRCPVDGAVWSSIYDPIMERARNDSRWRVSELATNHLAPIAAPALVAEALLDIVG